MSAKKRKRRSTIVEIVHERGTISVGALAEMLEVSTQTIRRDIDKLCEDDSLRRKHGRVELARQHLNTPFDERTATNPGGKRDIARAAADQIPNGASLFISIGSTPLSVAQALRRRKNLTVITNNLNAAMALSDELSNRIILPGGELRLPDRDILGAEVQDFFDRYRAEFGIFGVAGVGKDGSLLEFHRAEVQIRERICANSQTSLLVLDRTKFGRLAPAVGENIRDVGQVILDRRPDATFDHLLDDLGDRLLLAEREVA